MPGGQAFLVAMGFERDMDDDLGEDVLRLPAEELPAFLERVGPAMETLEAGKAPAGRLDRDTQVFVPDPARPMELARFALPDDFYAVSTKGRFFNKSENEEEKAAAETEE